MFEQLREAVDDLSVPVDGDALAAVLGIVDRLLAKVAAAVGEFDRAALWELDGATSMRAWLRDAGLTSAEASRLASTARRVRSLPVVARAWEAGELSGGQVQAIVHNVPDRLVQQFAEHEAEIVPTLVGLSVSDTKVAMNHWAAHAQALVDEPEPPARESSFHLSQTLDGVWVADGTFDAEGGALVTRAIELAAGDDYSIPLAQRRADALVDVARFFLDNQRQHPGGRHRPHINVIVDLHDLRHERRQPRGELVDHQLPLDPATTERLLCDCVIHRVLVDRTHRRGATIVEIAAATRSIPAALWSALVIRDRHCRFPPAATAHPPGATATTSNGSATTAKPASTTSSSSAEDTTNTCTATTRASSPNSNPTAPSTSSTNKETNASPTRRRRYHTTHGSDG